ncbi:macrolide ABC transporter ATP-binding protein/permease MacB [Yersinia pestis]|uniref:macrolide ABC transporter ATP-binding protein/permease MacB n=1 Tax=Yersinia pestis TaxID=632 RepID=UPI00036CF9BE|nr:macrolide ABC transporter ATP-binding protein/permease MacB [Yersinia pestis]AJK24593.1 ABC transporter family protein [Yersinia pestis Pestoides G]AKS57427.1 ABC transporter family protein [Yersinia pestis 1412]AKS77808.1 ABC transporter family protein [Yersinia pestis 1413]AKS94087.1 macrolide export ATP-binding/permease protein MacB [Yersinia pestis 3770]AKS97737.1 macrolide export ATP-binding/permease protein MacB [Yersinia pestis 3067]
MAALLELEGIRRSYQSGEEIVDVLQDVSLTINAGELVAIIGASGSGKSTLMNILGCLDKPSAGIYRVAGQNVDELDDDALAALRREHFGFIFQRYHLLPHLSAAHNVEVPAVYAGLGKHERRERANMLLTRLGLGDRVSYQPNQLSGGQQQRVSIARALMNGGQVILADEPTGALDSHSSVEVMAILKQLQQQGHTVIIVTHDPTVAAQAERVIEIKDGRIMADSGSKNEPVVAAAELMSLTPAVPSWQQLVGRFREALLMAWRAMSANKMRTALTMLGIIIGIASVVSILVVGDAAKQLVLADIRAIGTNTIDIYPGKDFGDDDPSTRQALVHDDMAALKAQSYVSAVSPSIGGSMRLRFGNIDVAASVLGVSDEYFRVFGMAMEQGAPITREQVERQAQTVVIDLNTQRRLFPHMKDVVGQVILVGNMPATVVGVVAEKKSMFGSNKALRVWVPYSTMANRLMGRSYFDSITIRIKEGYSSKEAEQQLVRLLTLRHGKKDIFTYNMDSLLQTAEKTTQTMQLFLTLVAVISLVVGGIGVMNIMLVSVTERTREIGIRMAVGARSSDVMQQFLIEAVLVCLIGGALGISLSFAIGLIVEMFLPNWRIAFPPMALFSAFLCSTVIGVVFGYLPARSAARLNPIDALARE